MNAAKPSRENILVDSRWGSWLVISGQMEPRWGGREVSFHYDHNRLLYISTVHMHYSYLGEVAISSKQIRVGLIISSEWLPQNKRCTQSPCCSNPVDADIPANEIAIPITLPLEMNLMEYIKKKKWTWRRAACINWRGKKPEAHSWNPGADLAVGLEGSPPTAAGSMDHGAPPKSPL